MLRSRALSYAILAATEVAQQSNGAGVQSHTVARTYDLPPAYGAKIMGQLGKARVLRSMRGPNGGFTLARPANKITRLEIFEAVNGPVSGGDAPELPDAIRRAVKAATGRAADVIRNRLEGVTLASLLKK